MGENREIIRHNRIYTSNSFPGSSIHVKNIELYICSFIIICRFQVAVKFLLYSYIKFEIEI